MRTVLFVLLASVVILPGARGQESAPTATATDQVIAKIIARETEEMKTIRQYSPLVETYVQRVKGDAKQGWIPDGDRYFLGRADFASKSNLANIDSPRTGTFHATLDGFNRFFGFTTSFEPRGFLQMIYVDPDGLNTQDYRFEYIRREFLGEVRTVVFDVIPIGKNKQGRFSGRIWADDESFTILRFNGTYATKTKLTNTFNFDSWRTNAGPNLWLPTFIYSEVGAPKFGIGGTIAFRGQTRLWAYNVGRFSQEEELSKILVESNVPIEDRTKQDNDLSPLEEQREWDHQAAQNVLDRLQRMGLIAPEGEVDKVLVTVTNNLEVTNHLDIEPEVNCRVLMTSNIESFSIGHTIVLSRGMIDVLPDEASLAVMVAKELAHILLDRQIDPRYAFYDQLFLPDEKKAFRQFDFARTKQEDAAAAVKGAELLANSPYKDQLKTARRFMVELQLRSKEIPNLINPRLGDAALLLPPITGDAKDTPAATDIVALPMGGRVKFDPWNNNLVMLKAAPVRSVGAGEMLPFQVTPFLPYLTRGTEPGANVSPAGN